MKNEYNEVLWGVYLLRIHEKNFKSDFVLVRESEGLYYIFLLLNVIDSKTVCDWANLYQDSFVLEIALVPHRLFRVEFRCLEYKPKW